MQLFRTLKDAKKEHWTEGIHWLIWSVLTGLLPIWIALLILRVYKQPISIGTFTDGGEFALYAASYLGTALYIVHREFNNRAFPSGRSLSLFLFLLLLFSALLYALVGSNSVLGNVAGLKLRELFDRDLLRQISIWLLPGACVITYLVVVAENVEVNPPIKKMSDDGVKTLNNEFDNLPSG